MNKIQEVTGQISGSIEQITAIGEEQAASIQQISTFIKEIQEMSNKLTEYAHKL